MDIIRRAAKIFDTVIVAVATDGQKDYLFNSEERVKMATQACGDIDNVMVEDFDGLLIKYCQRRQASVIVKGLRSSADMPDERQMQQINAMLAPDIETVFLLASPQYAHISSNMIKWVSELGGDISAYLPPNVAAKLKQKFT